MTILEYHKLILHTLKVFRLLLAMHVICSLVGRYKIVDELGLLSSVRVFDVCRQYIYSAEMKYNALPICVMVQCHYLVGGCVQWIVLTHSPLKTQLDPSNSKTRTVWYEFPGVKELEYVFFVDCRGFSQFCSKT